MMKLAGYHLLSLPRPEAPNDNHLTARALLKGFAETFASYFRKPDIVRAVLFILFFRLAEAGYPILSLKPLDMSLEDIFVRLTAEEVETASGRKRRVQK